MHDNAARAAAHVDGNTTDAAFAVQTAAPRVPQPAILQRSIAMLAAHPAHKDPRVGWEMASAAAVYRVRFIGIDAGALRETSAETEHGTINHLPLRRCRPWSLVGSIIRAALRTPSG